MHVIEQARVEIERAADLPGLLDASLQAFTTITAIIYREQDRGGSLFPAFVMAGRPASSGRRALAAAPSLPAMSQDAQPATGGAPPTWSAGESAAAVAGLSRVLGHRLEDAAVMAEQPGDRQACAGAARCAWALLAQLGEVPR
jgi:hypothetical protein